MITKIRLRILETAVFGFVASLVGFLAGLICGVAIKDSHEVRSTQNRNFEQKIQYSNYYRRKSNEG